MARLRTLLEQDEDFLNAVAVTISSPRTSAGAGFGALGPDWQAARRGDSIADIGLRDARIPFDLATGPHDLAVYANALLDHLERFGFLSNVDLEVTADEGTFALGDEAVITSESLDQVIRGTIRAVRETREGSVLSVGRRTVSLASLIERGQGGVLGFSDIVALGFPKAIYQVWGKWFYTNPSLGGYYEVSYGLGRYDSEDTLFGHLLEALIDDYDPTELDLQVFDGTEAGFTPGASPAVTATSIFSGSSSTFRLRDPGTYYVKARYAYAVGTTDEILGPFGDEWQVLVPGDGS